MKFSLKNVDSSKLDEAFSYLESENLYAQQNHRDDSPDYSHDVVMKFFREDKTKGKSTFDKISLDNDCD